MNKNYSISLNGQWLADYLSNAPYTDTAEPEFTFPDKNSENSGYITPITVPGYWEDMCDEFRKTPLHTKLEWNPMYTLQRYPQTGYVPDMALPNPVGCFVYQKKFSIDLSEIKGEAELYVGGVQNALSAWINGIYIGKHEGYSSDFMLKIPENALKDGENKITLAVSNNRLAGYMGRPVSGLTSRAANECTGGIYGDVELRFYPDGLRDTWVSTAKDLSAFTVYTVGADNVNKTVHILDGKKELYSGDIPAGSSSITISADGYKFWSPDEPKRYTAVVSTESQQMEIKFGIRRLTVEGTKLYLNGKPYIFRGVCEHCYHPITVHPTREKNYYRHVIRTMKSLGFNSIRFHTYVPMAEYLEAADELGIIIEVETPNNTTYSEWCDIVRFARHYTSANMYSSGNEMVIDEDYIEHLRACASMVHAESDSLFSPMSAMRGIEYHSWGDCKVETPFPHNPKRLAALGEFCDVYNCYSLGLTSYSSDRGDHTRLNERNSIYGKPLLSHEICINGTYCDLSLKDRYRGSRIGDTEFMSSVERHLADKGLLDRAPLYYKNSAAWQQMLRKNCFEVMRRTETFAGYDFLGDIDTHWHTFGYCVGMMNEFYELKPGETVANVLRYNSDAVLLADLPRCRNFEAGEKLEIPILISNFAEDIDRAALTLRISDGKKTLLRREIRKADIKCGELTELYRVSFTMPRYEKPEKLTLNVRLSGANTEAENVWVLYVYPKAQKLPSEKTLKSLGLTVTSNIDSESLWNKLSRGENVVLFGSGPFASEKTDIQLSVAGRTHGHLATVVYDHPLTEDLPNDGYCGWQFRQMLTHGKAAILDLPTAPFDPIIEIATTYKNARREALVFEYNIGRGKLLVCTLNMNESDPGARWFRSHIVSYAMSDAFAPKNSLTFSEFASLCEISPIADTSNSNEAANKNDITMN